MSTDGYNVESSRSAEGVRGWPPSPSLVRHWPPGTRPAVISPSHWTDSLTARESPSNRPGICESVRQHTTRVSSRPDRRSFARLNGVEADKDTTISQSHAGTIRIVNSPDVAQARLQATSTQGDLRSILMSSPRARSQPMVCTYMHSSPWIKVARLSMNVVFSEVTSYVRARCKDAKVIAVLCVLRPVLLKFDTNARHLSIFIRWSHS